MIKYDPYYRTLARRNMTEAQLIRDHGISSATLHRVHHNEPITTSTLDKLCAALNCRIGHIAVYVKDEE